MHSRGCGHRFFRFLSSWVRHSGIKSSTEHFAFTMFISTSQCALERFYFGLCTEERHLMQPSSYSGQAYSTKLRAGTNETSPLSDSGRPVCRLRLPPLPPCISSYLVGEVRALKNIILSVKQRVMTPLPASSPHTNTHLAGINANDSHHDWFGPCRSRN